MAINTDNFKAEVNKASCSVENDLNAICMGKVSKDITPPNLMPIMPQPSAGSFATHSIDNFHDLLNFLKATGVIMLGTSFRPELATPTAILLTGAFFYGIKNKLKINLK